MKPSYRTLALLAAALALPLGLSAQTQQIERTFPAEPDTVVEVRNQIGQVRIHGWSQPRVRVVAATLTRAVEPHIDHVANRIHVHTHILSSTAPAGDRVVDYEIWAPPDTNLNLYLEAGLLAVENFTEDVTIEAPAAAVHVTRLDGHTSVNTLSGSVDIDHCTGRVDATSVSGTLRFLDNDSRYLVAEATSGDIRYEGDFSRGGTYEFRNHDGTVELVVPATASFELQARSVEGQVVNEFPLTSRSHGRMPQYTGASTLLGTVHTGDALVRVTSFSGTIRLRKR